MMAPWVRSFRAETVPESFVSIAHSAGHRARHFNSGSDWGIMKERQRECPLEMQLSSLRAEFSGLLPLGLQSGQAATRPHSTGLPQLGQTSEPELPGGKTLSLLAAFLKDLVLLLLKEFPHLTHSQEAMRTRSFPQATCFLCYFLLSIPAVSPGCHHNHFCLQSLPPPWASLLPRPDPSPNIPHNQRKGLKT